MLNGGGIGQVQDITEALSTAFRGREQDVRSLIGQLDKFTAYLDDQKDDIIAAAEKPEPPGRQVRRSATCPGPGHRDHPRRARGAQQRAGQPGRGGRPLGKFSALTADTVIKTKENLVKELQEVGPVLQSLANAGPSLTRSLSLIPTFPFPNETFENFMRGDYVNLTGIIDLTLSRIDAGLFTGTKWACDLTELELQWGRTVGQYPSPCLAGGPFDPGNPLTIPYHWDQGR